MAEARKVKVKQRREPNRRYNHVSLKLNDEDRAKLERVKDLIEVKLEKAGVKAEPVSTSFAIRESLEHYLETKGER